MAVAFVAMMFFARSRQGWRLEAVGGALGGIFIPVAVVFLIVYFIGQPSVGVLVLIGVLLAVPAFFYFLVWWESAPPDPFVPASERALEAHSPLRERLEGWGLQFLVGAVGRRSLGIPSYVYVRPQNDLIVLVVGSNPTRPSIYVYSRIADHLAVLCTTYRSGMRPPGELRQRLPREPFPELLEAHREAARFLRSKGFAITADVEEEPLDFLRLLASIEGQNRNRPLQLLFGLAFGDLLDPPARPLAEQRGIERRLQKLPVS